MATAAALAMLLTSVAVVGGVVVIGAVAVVDGGCIDADGGELATPTGPSLLATCG